MSARSTARIGMTAALSVALLTGCGFQGARSIPLPGGEGTGSDAYKLTVEFEDVLDLAPQAAVKVDDVTVGSVDTIEVDGYNARVVVRVNGDVELPANTTASLRQTSLLGEKFVSLDRPPVEQATGQLRGGETIALERTTRSAEIEEVLGALSLVLNGGSLEQLRTINVELAAVLEGREGDIKDLLGQLDTFVGGLDAQKESIVQALDSLDRLSARLVDERETIATALDDIPDGVAVLSEQREQITSVLTGLEQLGDVAVQVIEGSQQNTVASLQALRPILENLNAAGSDLPNSLELLLTYPFPRTIDKAIKGDYANLFVTLDLDLATVLGNQGVPANPVTDLLSTIQNGPQQPAAPQQPTLPLQLPELDLDKLVPAPGSDNGLLGKLNPLKSSGNGGGLLGLMIGGLR